MSRFNISLNIGLVTSNGKPLREYGIRFGGEDFNADVPNILSLLEHRLSGQIQNYALVQSETEPTLTVICSTDYVSEYDIKIVVHAIANELQQDAIAGKIESDGFLVGDKAEEWGGKFIQDYYQEIPERIKDTQGGYSGHGATGGIQGHSKGEHAPCVIVSQYRNGILEANRQQCSIRVDGIETLLREPEVTHKAAIGAAAIPDKATRITFLDIILGLKP